MSELVSVAALQALLRQMYSGAARVAMLAGPNLGEPVNTYGGVIAACCCLLCVRAGVMA